MATLIPPISQDITPFTVTPQVNTATFPEDIDQYNTEQPGRITETNTKGEQMNAMTSAMNIVAVEVEESATLADDAAVSAAQSALDANSTSNNLGAWSGLTGPLSKGVSVTHTVSTWILNNNLADVTLSEPITGNSDWTEVSGVTQGEIDVLAQDITTNAGNITTNTAKINNSLPSIPCSNQQAGTFTIDNPTQLSGTNLQFIFANGFIDGHANNTGESFSGANVLDIANLQDGFNYVYKLEGGGYAATPNKPSYGKVSATSDYLLADGIWRDSAGVPLATPITYINIKIEYLTGQYVGLTDFDYPNTVLGMLVTTGNRFLIDENTVGTITNNQKYIFDYPIANTDYRDWDCKVELKLDDIWTTTEWIYNSSGDTAGAVGLTTISGIAIRTGLSYVSRRTLYSGTDTDSATDNITSALARIIATYQGVINA